MADKKTLTMHFAKLFAHSRVATVFFHLQQKNSFEREQKTNSNDLILTFCVVCCLLYFTFRFSGSQLTFTFSICARIYGCYTKVNVDL